MRVNPYSLIAADKPLLENNVVRSSLLANSIVFTTQGIPFFQAGDEMLRSKFGDHNSYQSPDHINRIRWENAGKYREVVDYYTGLIRLRKEHPAFRMDSKADMDKINILSSQDRLVAFTIGGNANGDSWSNIFVAYNGNDSDRTLSLPHDGIWYQVVNDKKAGVETLAQLRGNVTLPPFSAAVLHD
jgi:pullulanase